MKRSARSSLLPLLLLTLIVAEVRTQTPVPAAAQPSALPKEGSISLPVISSIQGPLRPPETSSVAQEKPSLATSPEPPPAAAPAPTAQLTPSIGYGLAFVLGLLFAFGVMFAWSRSTVFSTSETPRRPRMTVPLRTGAVVAGVAGLVILAVFAARRLDVAVTDSPAPQVTHAAQFAQSRFAIGLLSASGLKVDGPFVTQHDISDIAVSADQDRRVNLLFTFTPAGTTKMRELTSANIGRQLAFVIDGSPDVTHAMTIVSEIGEHAQLSFGSASDAKAFVARLEASRDAHTLYGTGRGVEDDARAVELLKKSADRGEAAAQTALGIRYATGDGVPADANLAVEWYRKSADQGYGWAQMLLELADATDYGPGGTQGYAATAQAIGTRFERAVALFTSAQQMRFAEMTARLRQEIADLKTRSAELDEMQTSLDAARRRVEAADGEWRAAKMLSDHAPVTAEKATAWGTETKQFLKELGDFHERWGLPRETDGERMVPKAQYDQYQREYAPYRERSAALEARMNAMKAKGPQVKALHDATAVTAEALARANEEVSGLQAALSAKSAEFETARTKCESDVRAGVIEAARELHR